MRVFLAAAALAFTHGVGAANSSSLRGLATTWETDDDNSILQLVSIPSSGAPEGSKVDIIGPFLWCMRPIFETRQARPILPRGRL